MYTTPAALTGPRQAVQQADYRASGHLVRVDAAGKRTSYDITIKAHWFPGVLRILPDHRARRRPREHPARNAPQRPQLHPHRPSRRQSRNHPPRRQMGRRPQRPAATKTSRQRPPGWPSCSRIRQTRRFRVAASRLFGPAIFEPCQSPPQPITPSISICQEKAPRQVVRGELHLVILRPRRHLVCLADRRKNSWPSRLSTAWHQSRRLKPKLTKPDFFSNRLTISDGRRVVERATFVRNPG